MRLWEVLHANSPEQTLAEVPAEFVLFPLYLSTAFLTLLSYQVKYKKVLL